MRRLSVAQPFSGGYVSEVPNYAIALDAASFAQDAYAPYGMMRQRRGFSRVSTTNASLSIKAVAKTKFAYTNSTRTLVSTLASGTPNTSSIQSYASGSYTKLVDVKNPTGNSDVYLPRCVYDGEIIFCHQSGERPLIRYSGALGTASTVSINPLNMPLGSFSVQRSDGTNWSAPTGGYFWFAPPDGSGGISAQPHICDRISSSDDSGVTNKFIFLENMQNTVAGATATATDGAVSNVGFSWPGVIVAEGTISAINGGAITTPGITPSSSVFFDSSNAPYGSDAIAAGGPGDTHDIAGITSTTATTVSTNWNISSGLATKPYRILRRCPFKDAAVHKRSLWGAGVKQYPSTLYVWPPDQNIGIPPQRSTPYPVTSRAGYTSGVDGFLTDSDYTLFSLDIPSRYDSTPIVALLSVEDGPLLVLKTDSVYGVYGTYDPTNRATGGGLTVNKLADWGGCIDIKSAISGESGVFWAGPDGIYTWKGGAVTDITAGRVQREWRALMAGFVTGQTTVSCGVAATAYLVVSVTGLDSSKTADAKVGPDDSSPADRTLVYDLRTDKWLGRISNVGAKHIWTAKPEDDGSACLFVTSIYEGITDLTPAFTPNNGGTPNDPAGTGPQLRLWSTASLAQAEGTEGDARLCDLSVHLNIYDTTTATSQLGATVFSRGGLSPTASPALALSSFPADTADRLNRYKRMVNRTGRIHQLRLDMSSTSNNNEKVEVAEIVMSFRDSRRGT